MIFEKGTYDNTYLFSLYDEKFMFDCENMVVAKIDGTWKSVVTGIKNDTPIEELYKNIPKEDVDNIIDNLRDFYDNGIFFSKEKVHVEPKTSYDKGLISLPPVHKCNLNCRYCFARSGDVYKGTNRKFTYEMTRKCLEFIYFDYLKECSSYRIDFVSGGEPLLNFEIIKYVREISDDLYKKTGKSMEMWMCTNGTLIDENVLEYLNKNKIGLGISIDGDKELHNRMRVDFNDEGSYERVIKSIRSIMDNSSLNRELREVWGLVVITSEVDSIVDIVKHHKQTGFKSIQMKIVRAGKNEPYSINESNYEKVKVLYSELIDFFKEEVKIGKCDHLKMILNDNDFIGKIIRRLIIKESPVYRCQAGKNKISITADGEIYPCDSFVGQEEFKMGDIYNGVDPAIKTQFIRASIYERKTCKDCWARKVCGGDCYHNSYLINKDMEEPDFIMCELIQHVIKISLGLLDFIDENNPDIGEYLYKFLNARNRISIKET